MPLLLIRVAAIACAVAGAVRDDSRDPSADTGEDGMSIETVPDAECPARLLSVTKDGKENVFQLEEEGLRYLEAQPSPLYIVPVLGVFRGGKSLLMNRCMGLQQPYTRGFGVGHQQGTHTRGIDICAQRIEDLGTVVWMDTEGLFSSEYAVGDYGPKLFSLALLFSSAVLLNSVKVLNDQFFSFFGEQQQVARVLRHGLAAEGLPEGDLLPRNLSIVWVLQQAIDYRGSNDEKLHKQLEAFLGSKTEETRQHVRKDFQHRLHVVPVATHDARLWSRLNTVDEADLSSDYKESVAKLRKTIFDLLAEARPMHAQSVGQQLRMYAELVQTEQFSGHIVREALENSRLGSQCNTFGRRILDLVGEPLPSARLADAAAAARSEAEQAIKDDMEQFHFGESWKAKLQSCMDSKLADTQLINDQRLLDLWETKARRRAESGDCFFLDGLIGLRDELWEQHRRPVERRFHAESVKLATALQRTRLVECFKAKHILMPFLPWLAWPLLALYLRKGILSGAAQLVMHTIVAAGAYVVAGTFRRLPPWLDLEWPLLHSRPWLLDTTMQVLPRVPWTAVGNLVGAVGTCWTGFKLVRLFADSMWREKVGGMAHMEVMKMNILLKRSQIAAQQQMLSALQDAHVLAQRRDEVAIRIALLRAVAWVLTIDGQDMELQSWVEPSTRSRIQALLKKGRLRESEYLKVENDDGQCCVVCAAYQRSDAIELALQGDWSCAMQQIVEALEAGHEKRKVPVSSASRAGASGAALRMSGARLRTSGASLRHSEAGSDGEEYVFKDEEDVEMVHRQDQQPCGDHGD